jgi:adenine phosphoribosyltransferase
MPAPGYLARLRHVADFPRPGILFCDMMPLLADAGAFAAMLGDLAAPWRAAGVTAVAGIESRGFILGAALAHELGAGFVPLRKPGKLPGAVRAERYELEYGEDTLEIQADALPAGQRVLLVDDVLATGGTLAAARRLVEGSAATLLGASVLLEIPVLGGRARWEPSLPLHALHAG